MKHVLLALICVVALATSVYADVTFSGGGGGGGGSGNAVATVTFAGQAGAIYFAGSMDNNVTANLTDTTNAPFTQANVGNLICVDQVGTSSTDACGTISSVTSSSVAVLSFQNISGGAKNPVEYAFGPDNSTALTAFNNALAAGPGGPNGKQGINAIVPAGYYAVGSTGHLIIPADRAVVITGAGGSVLTAPAGSSNGNVGNDSMPGTAFMTLTHSGSGSFVQATNSSGVATYNSQSRIQDMLLFGGVGFSRHADGMCTTCDGVDIINWNGLDLVNVGIQNFGRRGIYIDTRTTGTPLTNNIDVISMHHVFVYINGENGIRIGGTADGVANLDTFQMQNIILDGNSFIFGNGNNGVQDLANIKGMTIRDSGFQGNGTSGAGFPTSQAEISIEGQIQGGVIEANYIEMDTSGMDGIAVRTSSSPVAAVADSLAITGNQILSSASHGFAHVQIGTDTTHVIEGLTVNSNFFDGIPSNGVCMATQGEDLTDRGTWNWCQNSVAFTTLPVAYAITGSGYGCSSLTEGQEATQTNSTAACSAGTTMTTGGTTHCQVYCNGTSWIQTGR